MHALFPFRDSIKANTRTLTRIISYEWLELDLSFDSWDLSMNIIIIIIVKQWKGGLFNYLSIYLKHPFLCLSCAPFLGWQHNSYNNNKFLSNR
jgi:hypothetical protein